MTTTASPLNHVFPVIVFVAPTAESAEVVDPAAMTVGVLPVPARSTGTGNQTDGPLALVGVPLAVSVRPLPDSSLVCAPFLNEYAAHRPDVRTGVRDHRSTSSSAWLSAAVHTRTWATRPLSGSPKPLL